MIAEPDIKDALMLLRILEPKLREFADSVRTVRKPQAKEFAKIWDGFADSVAVIIQCLDPALDQTQ